MQLAEGDDAQPSDPTVHVTRWVLVLTAAFVLVGVAVTTLTSDDPPRGSPWAQITLTLLGVNMLVQSATVGRADTRATLAVLVTGGLSFVGACVWITSAFLRP